MNSIEEAAKREFTTDNADAAVQFLLARLVVVEAEVANLERKANRINWVDIDVARTWSTGSAILCSREYEMLRVFGIVFYWDDKWIENHSRPSDRYALIRDGEEPND